MASVAKGLIFLCFTASLGCEGQILGPARADRDSASGAGDESSATTLTPEECKVAAPEPGPSPLRRLTRAEYDHTVYDLLGDTTSPAAEFPEEEIGIGFNNNADAQVASTLLIEGYENAAADLATAAVRDLPKLLGCDPVAQGDTCVQNFLTTFGLRAYRRPLAQDEVDRLLTFYTESKQSYDLETAVSMALRAILQSPKFLYRLEALGSAPVSKLSGFEVATRLSYLLWATMPDSVLLDAAKSGQLDTPDGVRGQAQRMLDDARAEQSIVDFFSQWLDLEKLDKAVKDASVFPAFTPEIQGLLGQETRLFVKDVAFGGSVSTLLEGSYTFLNKTLATYYGIAGPAGDAFEKVSLPAERAGILTQGTFLASNARSNETGPVQRGLYVRERLLCNPPPPPPANVAPLSPPDPSLSTRERLAEHRANPACAGCHDLMDPVGLGFEHFDGIGRWRETDGGEPVDASGNVSGGTDVDGPFDGAAELAGKLAVSRDVRACVTRQWFRFGEGRGEAGLDQCTLQALNTALEQSGGNFRELILALTQTAPFLYRRNSP